ncbi:MAG TPA: hypothetical protein VN047_03995 [Sphingopyxis sp.]|uniref:hypothetical protein n=1 Tax=Sphingopyxis sp. TaxID=1908224 RepID=UPI002CE1300E|nr:hypothetical protein [Sphingopyxis sp.]HWW56036.1 hypothetical protein [Sphingopyxis sp.]
MPHVHTLLPITLVATAALALTSCNDVNAASEDTPATRNAPTSGGELVMLADGTTMVARKGTLSRNVADWLAGDAPDSMRFAFGSDAFVPQTARLSARGLGNAADLGTLLRATPDAQLILGGDADIVGPLAEARARTLARFLADRGILPNQVRVVTRDDAGRASGTNGLDNLFFRLERGKAPA